MRDIQEDHAIDAETEEHRGRARSGRRQANTEVAEPAEDEDQRDRRRHGADEYEPDASKHHEEQRQNHGERADGVHDALAAHQRFRLESDSMSTGEFDSHRRTGLVRVLGGSGGRAHRRGHASQPIVERTGESRVERRSPRPRNDDTAAAIRGDVATQRGVAAKARVGAAKRRQHQCEETSGILADELGHLTRRNREQLPALGNRTRQSGRFEAAQRLVELVLLQQQQLPAGEPLDVTRTIGDARIDAGNLRRLPQLLDPCVNVLVGSRQWRSRRGT